jgi:NAD(P)-dependent dehydrogenase (short-subunit alcohol dehydrogenase family)
MKGKIVLVTGATAGIGEVTVESLARQGAEVIGVGRSPAKCAAAQERIRRESGNPRVTYLTADLSSQAEVRRLAGEFKDRWVRLDVLVNNAGAFFDSRNESADGIEMTWALNHLGYFLLTNELLDLLRASAPARIVNVSSGAHYGGTINFADVQYRSGFNGWRAYAQSKLANVMHAFELARRLDGVGVTANALHPGFVATQFGHNNNGVMRWGIGVMQRLFALTPEEGARTQIHLASSPQVEGVTGKYFEKSKEGRCDPSALDQDGARRLWDLSLGMTAEKTAA